MRALLALVLIGALCSVSNAGVISYSGSASFVSSAQPNNPINVDIAKFDTSLGVLTGVTVEITYSGSVSAMADNDDSYRMGTVSAQMIREWAATGPGGLVTSGSKTITSAPVTLGFDDGDGGNKWSFDPSTPDGHDFSSLLSFSDEAAVGSPFSPALNLYEGPGNVTFTVTALKMINKLQWVGDAPDAWQQQVEDPKMDVKIKVTYEYIPEPATLAMLFLGMIPVLRRRTA